MDNFNDLLHDFKEKKRLERRNLHVKDINTRIDISSLEDSKDLTFWENVKDGKTYFSCLICERDFRDDQVVEKCPDCDHFYHYREFRERKKIFSECPNCKAIRHEKENIKEDNKIENLLPHINESGLQEDLIPWKEVHKDQDYINCLICKKEFNNEDLLEDCPICGTYFHYLEYIEWSEKKSDCPRCREIIAQSILAGEELPVGFPSDSSKEIGQQVLMASETESKTLHKIFISYSSTNEEIADKIVEKLEELDVKCWIAHRDIIPSEPYARAILEAINSSQIFIVLFSKTSNVSHHVRREVELAVSLDQTLLPVRIENIEPTGSMKYYLSATHWLNAFDPTVEDNLNNIAEVIKKLLA